MQVKLYIVNVCSRSVSDVHPSKTISISNVCVNNSVRAINVHPNKSVSASNVYSG